MNNSTNSVRTLQTFITTTTAPIGAYVVYKDTVHIIVDANEDNTMYKILNPLKGNSKLQVASKNLGTTPFTDATVVSHKGNLYLRTVKDCIISIRTGRVMAWGTENGDRLAILAA